MYICIGVFKAHLFHMKKVRLKTVGVQLSKKQQNGYTLILEEQFGDRKLPILIGAFEAQAILIHLENTSISKLWNNFNTCSGRKGAEEQFSIPSEDL